MPSKPRGHSPTSRPPAGLRFVGPGSFAGVPARDLTTADIERLAYLRAYSVMAGDGHRPDPRRPDPHLIQVITAELIGSGLYERQDRSVG